MEMQREMFSLNAAQRVDRAWAQGRARLHPSAQQKNDFGVCAAERPALLPPRATTSNISLSNFPVQPALDMVLLPWK